jgi:ribosomal protein L37E
MEASDFTEALSEASVKASVKGSGLNGEALCKLCGLRPPWNYNVVICGVCFGFEKGQDMTTRADVVTHYDPEAESAARKNEAKCNRCGKTSNEVKFYPSRKDKCAPCITGINRQNRSNIVIPPPVPIDPPTIDPVISAEIGTRPETSTSDQEARHSVVKDSLTTDLQPEAPDFSTCNWCGQAFAVYMHGAVRMKTTCKACLKKRQTDGSTHEKRIERGLQKYLEESGSILVSFAEDLAILNLLEKDAKRERRTLENQILVILERVLVLDGGE